MRDITKLSGYPHSNDKTRLEQSNYSLASGRFPLQNAIYDNKLPFSQYIQISQSASYASTYQSSTGKIAKLNFAFLAPHTALDHDFQNNSIFFLLSEYEHRSFKNFDPFES